MVRIKTCRLTRNPQLGDPVAWLNLTLADGRELDDVALHRSPDDRLRHETGHEAAGRQAIRDQGSETTIGWPGCAVG
jgi:hypothetical protein